MIVVVTHRGEPHGMAVHKKLLERGAKAHLVDVGRFPMAARATFWVGAQTFDGHDLTDVSAVWLRRYGVRHDTTLGVNERNFARVQSQCFLTGLAQVMRNAAWFNPIEAAILQDGGAGKLAQLHLASGIGLPIPRTCVTSNPDDAKAFVASASGPCITKVLESVRGHEVYTRRIAATDNFDLVARCPTILQEEIPKRVEIRAVLAGERGLATEIDSQARAASQVDFRRDLRVTHRPHALPEQVWSLLRQLHRELGLRFGVHDLIQRPDGSYVYLETNQQGEFLWLQERTGQDYAGLVADALTLR